MSTVQERKSVGSQPTVVIKCVVCGHRETIPLTSEQPMCPKCFGPVVAEKVTRRG